MCCNYKKTVRVESIEELKSHIENFSAGNDVGPVLIEVMVKKGARKDLIRPLETPKENKELFQENPFVELVAFDLNYQNSFYHITKWHDGESFLNIIKKDRNKLNNKEFTLEHSVPAVEFFSSNLNPLIYLVGS